MRNVAEGPFNVSHESLEDFFPTFRQIISRGFVNILDGLDAWYDDPVLHFLARLRTR